MQDPTLAPTTLIDSDHPDIRAFARRHSRGNDKDTAVALYYAVRDGFRYDPYRIDLSPAGMRASSVLAQGYGAGETTSGVCALTIQDHLYARAACPERLASCGQPLLECDVQILDDDGYWRAPELSA